MTPKQFFNYMKKEYNDKEKPIVAPKKPAKEVKVEGNDLLDDDYTKILRDTDIDDVIAGLVDEDNPMTMKKVAETIGDKAGLDDRRIEKVFEDNADFKQFITDYVTAVNDENEPDKPKLIHFLRFRVLEKENKAMKKETTEEEKLKVEAMNETDFERYIQQKKIAVIGHQTTDFLNKGGKVFNEMYIDEHVRRGLKGVLKPNYLRDLANQLGVEVNTLTHLSKTDEGLNKFFNDQLTAIRQGIKQKYDEKKQSEKKEKEKQEKKQMQKQKAQEYLKQKKGKGNADDEMPHLEEPEDYLPEHMMHKDEPVTPTKQAIPATPASGIEVFGTPMSTEDKRKFMETLQDSVSKAGDRLTDREATVLGLLKTKANPTPKEMMKIDFVVKSLSPVKGEIPKYNTRSKDQKTDYKLYEDAHKAINQWEKEATNIKNATFIKKLSQKLGKTEEEIKKLDNTYGLYKVYQTSQKSKK